MAVAALAALINLMHVCSVRNYCMVVLAGERDDVFQVIQVLLCAPACLVCTIACTASRRVIDVTTPRH